jgi:hypothetical protein
MEKKDMVFFPLKKYPKNFKKIPQQLLTNPETGLPLMKELNY